MIKKYANNIYKMPYNNAYNRMIADDIMALNQKYIEHDKKMGDGLSGGFLGALAGAILPTVVGAISKNLFGFGKEFGEMPAAFYEFGDASKEGDGYSGAGLSAAGGSGFAEGSFMDTGYDRTIGAGLSAGVKVYKKRKERKSKKVKGGVNELGLPDSLAGGALVPVANMQSSSMAGMGKRGRKKKGGAEEIGCGLSAAGLSAAGRSGAGLSAAGRSGAGRSGAGLSAAGLSAAGRSGAGRSGAGRSGAGRSGAGLSAAGRSGAGSSGAGLSGAADGRKRRAELVKKIMKEKGMKMIEASKYVKENNLYSK